MLFLRGIELPHRIPVLRLLADNNVDIALGAHGAGCFVAIAYLDAELGSLNSCHNEYSFEKFGFLEKS